MGVDRNKINRHKNSFDKCNAKSNFDLKGAAKDIFDTISEIYNSGFYGPEARSKGNKIFVENLKRILKKFPDVSVGSLNWDVFMHCDPKVLDFIFEKYPNVSFDQFLCLQSLLFDAKYGNLCVIFEKFPNIPITQLDSLSTLFSSGIQKNFELTFEKFPNISLEQLRDLPFLTDSSNCLKFIFDNFNDISIKQLQNIGGFGYYELLQLLYDNLSGISIEQLDSLCKVFQEGVYDHLQMEPLFSNFRERQLRNLELIFKKFPNISINQLNGLSSFLSGGNPENLELIFNKIDDIEGLYLGIFEHGKPENIALIFNKFKNSKISVNQLNGLFSIFIDGNSKNLELIFNKFPSITIEELVELSNFVCFRTYDNLERLLCEKAQNEMNPKMFDFCSNISLANLIKFKNIKFCNLKNILDIDKLMLIDLSKAGAQYTESLNFILSWGIPDRVAQNLARLKGRKFGKYNGIIENWPLVISWCKPGDLDKLKNNDVDALNNINAKLFENSVEGTGQSIGKITDEVKSNKFWELCLDDYLNNYMHVKPEVIKFTRNDLLQMSHSIRYSGDDLENIKDLDAFFDLISLQIILNYLSLDYELSTLQNGRTPVLGNADALRHFSYNITKESNSSEYLVNFFTESGKKQENKAVIDINNFANFNVINFKLLGNHINLKSIEGKVVNNLEFQKLLLLFFKWLKDKYKGNYKNKINIFNEISCFNLENRGLYAGSPISNLLYGHQIDFLLYNYLKLIYLGISYQINREVHSNIYGNESKLPELLDIRNYLAHGHYVIGPGTKILFYDDNNQYRGEYDINRLIAYCDNEYNWLNGFRGIKL